MAWAVVCDVVGGMDTGIGNRGFDNADVNTEWESAMRKEIPEMATAKPKSQS